MLEAPFLRRGRWPLMLLGASAAALVAVAAYQLGNDASGDPIHEAVSNGETAPAPHLDVPVLTAGDLSAAPRRLWRAARDGRVSLPELRGSPVVLNVWSARCEPCRDQGQVLQQMAREAGHGVLMLGISTHDSADAARRFVDEHGLSFPQAHDPGMDTAHRWGVTSVPETFVISADGRVVGHVVGVATADHVARGIDFALAGRPSGLHMGARHEPLE
jgi:peroxiredoxin